MFTLHKLFFVFLLLYSFEGKAQKDYIIDDAGDTTFGKLTYTFSGNLKFSSENNTSICDPVTIKEYYQHKGNRLVYSRKLPEKGMPSFVDVLEKGEIMLYQFSRSIGVGKTSQTITTWYAQKGKDYLKEIKTSELKAGRVERKDALASLTQDNPGLAERLRSETSFSFKAIRKIIQDYNEQALVKKVSE